MIVREHSNFSWTINVESHRIGHPQNILRALFNIIAIMGQLLLRNMLSRYSLFELSFSGGKSFVKDFLLNIRMFAYSSS